MYLSFVPDQFCLFKHWRGQTRQGASTSPGSRQDGYTWTGIQQTICAMERSMKIMKSSLSTPSLNKWTDKRCSRLPMYRCRWYVFINSTIQNKVFIWNFSGATWITWKFHFPTWMISRNDSEWLLITRTQLLTNAIVMLFDF